LFASSLLDISASSIQNSGETAATFPKEKTGKIVLPIRGDRKNINCNSQNNYFNGKSLKIE
jgi:hypothetical protein